MEIPRFRLEQGNLEKKHFNKSVQSGQFAAGNAVQLFEETILQMLSQNYAATTSNGFSALALAIKALGLNNQKIIVPAISTCSAILNAVRLSRNSPVFCDLDEKTLAYDHGQLERTIQDNNPGLIIGANYFGSIHNYSTDLLRGIPLLEDNAQSILTDIAIRRPMDHCVGRIYSFYPTKGLNAIDGGMVVSNKVEIVEAIKNMRSYHGVKGDDGEMRFNFRMNNINCALGLDNAAVIEENIEKRKQLEIQYRLIFDSYDFVNILNKEGSIIQKFVLNFANSELKNRFYREAVKASIGVSSEFNFLASESLENYKGSQAIMTHHLSIPFYEGLSDQELNYMLNTCSAICDKLMH